MATKPTYESQLAQRAADLLGDVDTGARLELLGVMTPDEMSASLAFIAAMYPQAFDHGLVRDRQLTARLRERAR